jgi:hypothetical protein
MPSSDAGSLAIQAEGGIRDISGGVGESGRTDLQALSSLNAASGISPGEGISSRRSLWP